MCEDFANRPLARRDAPLVRKGSVAVSAAVDCSTGQLSSDRLLARVLASTTPSSRRTEANCSPVQSALRLAASWASLFRIRPSARIFSPLARRVAPVVVMSTISSAWPADGAPSVAPLD